MTASPEAVRLIAVPYHAGTYGVSMGRGPLALLDEADVEARLRDAAFDVDVARVRADDPGPDDGLFSGEQMSRHLIQDRAAAALVSDAKAAGRFPLLLSGNCNTSLGVVAGLDIERLGVVWFDGHPDSDTPDTSGTGLFDGMCLATLTGQCWERFRRSIPGFREILNQDVVFIGGHAPQRYARPRPPGVVVGADTIHGGAFDQALAEALDGLAGAVDAVYVHVDLDVLEPDEVRANAYGAAGGLPVAMLRQSIAAIGQRLPIAAATFACFDPDVDPAATPVVAGLVEDIATAALRRA